MKEKIKDLLETMDSLIYCERCDRFEFCEVLVALQNNTIHWSLFLVRQNILHDFLFSLN